MITKIHPLEIYNNVIKNSSHCFLCNPTEGSVLYETTHFRVIIDPFPVHAGHLMITSKMHIGSAGEISQEREQDFYSLKEMVEKKMRVIDGDCIFYEHGRYNSALHKSSANHDKHFQLHCLPVNISIKEFLDQRFQGIPMHKYQDIRALFDQYGDYLYFETTKGEKYFYPIKIYQVGSHLLRTLVCNTLGIGNRADWRTYQEAMTFVKSYELIENFMRWD